MLSTRRREREPTSRASYALDVMDSTDAMRSRPESKELLRILRQGITWTHHSSKYNGSQGRTRKPLSPKHFAHPAMLRDLVSA